MSQMKKEIEIKLDIMESLARSQKALARIIESMADVTVSSDKAGKKLLENIEVIALYQQALAKKLAGVQVRRKRIGKPAKPWLSRSK